MAKNPAVQETEGMQVQPLGQEDILEQDRATHSSILAWRIPRTEEPGGLHSIRSQRVGYDWSDLAGRHEINAMVNMRLFASEDLLNSPFLPALAFHWSYHLTYQLSSFSHPHSLLACSSFLILKWEIGYSDLDEYGLETNKERK